MDLDLLADRFFELQKEVHPDRFASRPDQEKRLAMQWTTLINTASDTLKSPLKRAIYLLGLRGVELAENPQLPPEFLMEQIELRERLEEIETGDASLEELDGSRRKWVRLSVRWKTDSPAPCLTIRAGPKRSSMKCSF